jgi:prophage antirepressor-like protein
MYFLIARSNSPVAIPFQKWAFEEVLPTIRKTGYYAPSSGRHLPPALEPTFRKRYR